MVPSDLVRSAVLPYPHPRHPSTPSLPAGMVDFHDPNVILQDTLTLVKFWHALIGLYIWEFFTTLDFEWGVIRGTRPYVRTIWVYSLTRVAALATVICNVIVLDAVTPINCQITATFQLVLGYCTFAAASLLIILRIIAIWNRNKIAIGIVVAVWGTNISFFVESISRLRAVQTPAPSTCVVFNIEHIRVNFTVLLVSDLTLLVIMLVGLLRLCPHRNTMFSLAHFLWKQCLIWLLIAAAAGVPPTVFIWLNLNDPFDEMFLLPSMITMSIAATRMHRSLADFGHGSGDIAHVGSQRSPAVSKPNGHSSCVHCGRSDGGGHPLNLRAVYDIPYDHEWPPTQQTA